MSKLTFSRKSVYRFILGAVAVAATAIVWYQPLILCYAPRLLVLLLTVFLWLLVVLFFHLSTLADKPQADNDKTTGGQQEASRSRTARSPCVFFC